MRDQEITRICELVAELESTNSKNDKVSILEKYKDCSLYLEYTYNPFKKFGVSSDKIRKFSKKNTFVPKKINQFSDLLDLLYKRVITGDEALFNAQYYIEQYSDENRKEVMYRIIDKNLKVRIDDKLVNKVFENLIPEFSVALAKSIDDYLEKVDFSDGTWRISRKLDGVRVLCIIQDSGIEFFSRDGNKFGTLGKLEKCLEGFQSLSNHVIDGEVCIMNGGKEDFKTVVGDIKRKNFTIENPVYKVFDCIPLQDFLKESSDFVLDIRRVFAKNALEDLWKANPISAKHVHFLEDQVCLGIEHLKEEMRLATLQGWEGLMVRRNVVYEGKRTKNLLKMKKFHDQEFKVLDVIQGTMNVANTITNKEEQIDCLSAVVIEYKGNRVQVGSGFSIPERKEYFKNPENILGKILTVAYFEESCDKDGKPSLRFPTVKIIHGDKRVG